MDPLVVYKKENGKVGIIRGHNKIKILRMMGFTELRPEMYNYSDNTYRKDVLKIIDIEDDLIK